MGHFACLRQKLRLAAVCAIKFFEMHDEATDTQPLSSDDDADEVAVLEKTSGLPLLKEAISAAQKSSLENKSKTVCAVNARSSSASFRSRAELQWWRDMVNYSVNQINLFFGETYRPL